MLYFLSCLVILFVNSKQQKIILVNSQRERISKYIKYFNFFCSLPYDHSCLYFKDYSDRMILLLIMFATENLIIFSHTGLDNSQFCRLQRNKFLLLPLPLLALMFMESKVLPWLEGNTQDAIH